MRVEISPEEARALRDEVYAEGRRAGYGDAARKARAEGRWAEPELAVLRMAVEAARRDEPSPAWDSLANALAGAGRVDGVAAMPGVDASVRDMLRRCAEALSAEGRELRCAG